MRGLSTLEIDTLETSKSTCATVHGTFRADPPRPACKVFAAAYQRATVFRQPHRQLHLAQLCLFRQEEDHGQHFHCG